MSRKTLVMDNLNIHIMSYFNTAFSPEEADISETNLKFITLRNTEAGST
jgi:hypothetical protein